jgi:hypothetical protein
MSNRLTIAIFLGFLSSLWIQNTYACSCVQLTLKEQYQMAEHVFVGRITKAREIKSRSVNPNWKGVLGEFQTLQTLKGNPVALQNIETGYGHGGCGVTLTVGQAYLFFADRLGSVDICTGSRTFTPGTREDEEILKELKGYIIQHSRP